MRSDYPRSAFVVALLTVFALSVYSVSADNAEGAPGGGAENSRSRLVVWGSAKQVQRVGENARPGMLSRATRCRQVGLDPALGVPGNFAVGDNIALSLFDDATYRAVVDRVATNVNGTVTVRGRIQWPSSGRVLLLTTNGRTLVDLRVEDGPRRFLVDQDQSNHTYLAMELSDQGADVLEGGPTLSSAAGSTEPEQRDFKSDALDSLTPTTVDVMVVYTPAALAWANSNGGIENVIQGCIEEGQVALNNSSTFLNLRLTRSDEVAYTESGNTDTDLRRLTDTGDGYMDQVHSWRNAHAADLVALLATNNDYGGMSWFPNRASALGSPEWGFSVDRIQQSYDSPYTFVHELGHNLGCDHRRNQPVEPATGKGKFDYSCAWGWTGTDGGHYCSVMSYTDGTVRGDGYYARVPYFSNPSVTYKGASTGTADDDNARTIREFKDVVAGYRSADGEEYVCYTGSGRYTEKDWIELDCDGTIWKVVLKPTPNNYWLKLDIYKNGALVCTDLLVDNNAHPHLGLYKVCSEEAFIFEAHWSPFDTQPWGFMLGRLSGATGWKTTPREQIVPNCGPATFTVISPLGSGIGPALVGVYGEDALELEPYITSSTSGQTMTVTIDTANLNTGGKRYDFSLCFENKNNQGYPCEQRFLHDCDLTVNSCTYVISGHVRDAAGTGIEGVVINGLPGPPTTGEGGYYYAIVGKGWSGQVGPTKDCYAFSPMTRPYSSVTSNQVDQDYTGTATGPGTPANCAANPGVICLGGSSTLSATPGSGGDVVVWYSGSCEGTPVTSLVSPISTTVYFAKTKNLTTGCLSSSCAAGVTVTVSPVPPVSVAEAKAQGDSTFVWLVGKAVTYASQDCFYVEEDNRSCGIRIEKPGHGRTAGMRADVTGTMQTNTYGERYIQATVASQTAAPNDTGSIAAVAMSNKAIGGGTFGGQQGIMEYRWVSENGAWVRKLLPIGGLSNIGLLVTTFGRVTYVGPDHFYIDDGSRTDDDSGQTGVKVLASGTEMPSVGAYRAVTGISSCYARGGMNCRLLRPRTPGDVVPLAADIWGVKSLDGPNNQQPSLPPATLFRFAEDGTDFITIGAVTLSGAQIDVDGLAMSQQGDLYGFQVDIAGSRLIRINKTDASAVVIGPILTGRLIRGATFTLTGRLLALHAAEAQTGELVEVSTSTGTQVGAAVPLRLDGVAHQLSDMTDIAQRSDGAILICSNGSKLYEVNTTTGDMTLLNDPHDACAHAGLAFSSGGALANSLFAYQVIGADNIIRYDAATGGFQTIPYSNIIDGYNSGRGDLASVVSPSSGAVEQLCLPDGGRISVAYVPSGSFLMGNNGSEGYCEPAEIPQHAVSLSGYWIGVHEVTRGQYRGFLSHTGRSQPPHWQDRVCFCHAQGSCDLETCPYAFTQQDNYPVVGVNYHDAQAFCDWAGLRLPTEAEWEKAARWSNGQPLVFPWGDVWGRDNCNNWFDAVCPGYRTSAAGSYHDWPSPYGCCDMAGNAEEWVQDWYLEDYYSESPGTNPQGPPTGEYRVLRGGSWDSGPEPYTWRCAARDWDAPTKQHARYGFRVAR